MINKFYDASPKLKSKKASDLYRINKAITAIRVRLIDSKGQMVGIVDKEEALRMALEENLDLVEVAPGDAEPVCKILSYSKFIYENKKRTHELKKKKKTVKMKELKIRPNIGENDYNIKLKNARDFLEEGHRIKLTLRLKGREMLFKNLASAMLEKFQKDLAEVAKPESPVKREGSQFQLIMIPNRAPAAT